MRIASFHGTLKWDKWVAKLKILDKWMMAFLCTSLRAKLCVVDLERFAVFKHVCFGWGEGDCDEVLFRKIKIVFLLVQLSSYIRIYYQVRADVTREGVCGDFGLLCDFVKVLGRNQELSSRSSTFLKQVH